MNVNKSEYISFDYCHFICKSYVYNVRRFVLSCIVDSSVWHRIIIILQCVRVCPPSKILFDSTSSYTHSLTLPFAISFCVVLTHSTLCDIIIVLLEIYLLTHRKKKRNRIERRKQFIHIYSKKKHKYYNVCE